MLSHMYLYILDMLFAQVWPVQCSNEGQSSRRRASMMGSRCLYGLSPQAPDVIRRARDDSDIWA